MKIIKKCWFVERKCFNIFFFENNQKNVGLFKENDSIIQNKNIYTSIFFLLFFKKCWFIERKWFYYSKQKHIHIYFLSTFLQKMLVFSKKHNIFFFVTISKLFPRARVYPLDTFILFSIFYLHIPSHYITFFNQFPAGAPVHPGRSPFETGNLWDIGKSVGYMYMNYTHTPYTFILFYKKILVCSKKHNNIFLSTFIQKILFVERKSFHYNQTKHIHLLFLSTFIQKNVVLFKETQHIFFSTFLQKMFVCWKKIIPL